jgi:hypothetical protein
VRIAGYRVFCDNGTVVTFGEAPDIGGTQGRPVVAACGTPDGAGAWLLGADGGIFGAGDPPFHGSVPGRPDVRFGRAVDLACTPSGNGYWILDEHGVVVAFGDAPDLGPAPTLGEHVRFTRIVSHPIELGYWLTDHVGGVFSFGEARFFGSLPGVDMATLPADLVPTASGDGYLVVARDGRCAAFGAAVEPGEGVDPSMRRTHGIVAAVRGAVTGSALAVDIDGVVFPIGAAPFLGSPVGELGGETVIGIDVVPGATNEVDPLDGLKLPLERRRFSGRR